MYSCILCASHAFTTEVATNIVQGVRYGCAHRQAQFVQASAAQMLGYASQAPDGAAACCNNCAPAQDYTAQQACLPQDSASQAMHGVPGSPSVPPNSMQASNPASAQLQAPTHAPQLQWAPAGHAALSAGVAAHKANLPGHGSALIDWRACAPPRQASGAGANAPRPAASSALMQLQPRPHHQQLQQQLHAQQLQQRPRQVQPQPHQAQQPLQAPVQPQAPASEVSVAQHHEPNAACHAAAVAWSAGLRMHAYPSLDAGQAALQHGVPGSSYLPRHVACAEQPIAVWPASVPVSFTATIGTYGVAAAAQAPA